MSRSDPLADYLDRPVEDASYAHPVLAPTLREVLHFFAPDGQPGSGNDRYGKYGEQLTVEVPEGTVVRTADGEVVADLLLAGETYRAAKGGRGGRGNARFATSTNRAPTSGG